MTSIAVVIPHISAAELAKGEQVHVEVDSTLDLIEGPLVQHESMKEFESLRFTTYPGTDETQVDLYLKAADKVSGKLKLPENNRCKTPWVLACHLPNRVVLALSQPNCIIQSPRALEATRKGSKPST